MNRVCLILDDERSVEKVIELTGIQAEEYHLVRSYDEFVDYIDSNLIPDFVSFDHDICSFDKNGKELTGIDAARALIHYCFEAESNLPKCFCHSSNPAGKANIESYIASAVKSGFVKQVDF